ncbi:MAG: hypothetical protein K9L28_08035 [Synergistales bacterium]|nr:hypothetical protein [Synergistales bacterium]
MQSVQPPFWHPAASDAVIFDWDGVLAETKLDFSPVFQRFFGGKRVLLLEALPTLEPDRRDELENALLNLEIQGAREATPVPGARECIAYVEELGLP